jgi:hypothetical protein
MVAGSADDVVFPLVGVAASVLAPIKTCRHRPLMQTACGGLAVSHDAIHRFGRQFDSIDVVLFIHTVRRPKVSKTICRCAVSRVGSARCGVGENDREPGSSALIVWGSAHLESNPCDSRPLKRGLQISDSKSNFARTCDAVRVTGWCGANGRSIAWRRSVLA